ncbi:MAG: DUF559 domain-containing protein [Phycisphaeraceae bacterium]|nr:DUF559 domain-containing protein [Phycisphaeraceae bacterium]
MTHRARTLRQNAPTPERILWGLLRARRLGGLKFRRQVPIGPYVADYVCEDTRLVVELDGMTHDGRGAEDAHRTSYLQQQGLRVLRVTNDDLLTYPDAVAALILKSALTPALSQGERGKEECGT